MQGITAPPPAHAPRPPAVHTPTFSCVFPGPVDEEIVGQLLGPDLDGREAFRLTHTEPTGDGRTRAFFEPVPIQRVRQLALDELVGEQGLERMRAQEYWGRR